MTNPNPYYSRDWNHHHKLLKEKDARIQELEKQNDHLEEGCRERDKELVELREQYANACQTIADLQVKYGEAMSELNKLKHPF